MTLKHRPKGSEFLSSTTDQPLSYQESCHLHFLSKQCVNIWQINERMNTSVGVFTTLEYMRVYSVVSDPVTPWTVAWDFSDKNTGVGCHFLLQGSSQPRDRTQLSCVVRRILYHWSTKEAQNLVPHYRTLISLLWAAFSYFPVKYANILVSHIHIPPGCSNLSSLLEKRAMWPGNQIDAFPPFPRVNPGLWPKVP